MTINSPSPLPDAIEGLQRAFGGPNQSAFGSATFFEPKVDEASLEKEAFTKYQHFCGSTWTRFGEENWRAAWKLLYASDSDGGQGIITTLNNLNGLGIQSIISMLLEAPDAEIALVKSFEGGNVESLQIYSIGDGSAMSGILIAAQRVEGRVFLLFLMD